MNLNSLKNNRLKNDIEIINNEILKNIKKKMLILFYYMVATEETKVLFI